MSYCDRHDSPGVEIDREPAKTPGPAARWLALGLGPTHSAPVQHDHMGRTYACGLYVGREQGSSRAAPRQVTTMPGDEVNCPGCIEAAQREEQRERDWRNGEMSDGQREERDE